jgi:hypothetical protein
MSLFAPYHRGVQYSRNYTGRPATSQGTVITAGGSSHALSAAFADVFASTSHDATLVAITILNSRSNAAQSDILLNLYVGASGAETVLIPNLLGGWTSDGQVGGRTYVFPLYIPAGTRISAKSQALIASDTLSVYMELYGGGEPLGWAGQGVECLGAVTASSRGTSVTPGAAAEGTFTDIGTSTREYRYVLVMAQGSMTDTNMAATVFDADVGVGGALLQTLEGFCFYTSGNELTGQLTSGLGRFAVIPSGTALQLRGQVSTATAEPLDCCIYGVY